MLTEVRQHNYTLINTDSSQQYLIGIFLRFLFVRQCENVDGILAELCVQVLNYIYKHDVANIGEAETKI